MTGQLKQMESQTRPWVGLDEDNRVQTGPLVIDVNGNINTNCTMTVKNYGNYPAQNVLPFCGLAVLQGNIMKVHERIVGLCREGVPVSAGSVLFQGHKASWNWGALVANSQFLRDPSGGRFYAFLVGCVNYRDQFNVCRCTAFSFKRNFAGTINTVSFEPTPNMTIPGEWVQTDGVIDPQ